MKVKIFILAYDQVVVSGVQMILYHEPNFLKLPTELEPLFATASGSSFFSETPWYDLMTRQARISGSSIRLYTDTSAPTVGLVMCSEGDRRLHSFSNAYSLEYSPIMSRAERSVDQLKGLITAVAREDASRERITFAALDSGSDAYTALSEGLRSAGWLVKRFVDCGVWYENTTNLSFADYFSSRPSMLKNTYKRKERASIAEGAKFRYLDEAGDIESFIGDYETIYRKSWKQPELFAGLIPDLIRLAYGLGALRMGVIYVGGRPAASQFWLLWYGRAVIYKLAHDVRFDHLSLGTILTMRMMERVLSGDRPQEINFGRGDDPYKKLWLRHRRERWGLYAVNPRTLHGAGTAARWLAASGRDWIAERLRKRDQRG